MRIYTRTGDGGQTSLRWGERVPKNALRVEVYGTVDEANAHIGLAVACLEPAESGPLRALLLRVQRELFDVGADLATPPDRERGEQPRVTEQLATRLEADIDELERGLDPLRNFVLPGGTRAAAALHVARTVVRRAERQLVALAEREPVDPALLKYLNRLSDLLFVAARAANRAAGQPDVIVEWGNRH